MIRPNSRKFTAGNVNFRTTVPPDIDLFDRGEKIISYDRGRLGYRINPMALEDIDPGTYAVSSWRRNKISPLGQPSKYSQLITVQHSEHGKVISEASLGTDLSPSIPTRDTKVERAKAVAPLMGKLGFILGEDSRVVALPSPVTFERAATQHNMSVQICTGAGLLDNEAYLRAFADGNYPVAAGKENYYLHDIGDDHATAMLLGGSLLRGALQDVAANALATGDTAEMPAAIDNYTSTLRLAVVEDGIVFDAYHQSVLMAPTAEAALYGLGQEMQLPRSATTEIIDVARDTARMWEVPVRTA